MEVKKGFAFVDEGGVLHIIEDNAAEIEAGKPVFSNKKLAEERAVGAVIVVDGNDIPFEHGYPVADGKEITVYGVNECYIDSNRDGGAKLDTEAKYPALAALYGRLV